MTDARYFESSHGVTSKTSSSDVLAKRTVLPQGPVVVTISDPSAVSVSLGAWVASGSRVERPGQYGLAHLLEHMAFKGAGPRDATAIARVFDLLGGLGNAYTSRETTGYTSRVAAADTDLALELVCDLTLRPTLDPTELEREKGVIVQELRMVEESPEEALHEKFWEECWREPSLGHPILGSENDVRGFSVSDLAAFRQEHYVPSNIIVAAAGDVDHERFVGLAAGHFEGAAKAPVPEKPEQATYRPARLALARDAESDHILFGFPCVGMKSERRYSQLLLSTLTGGSMSSRLFQEIRERRGLAYNVYSNLNSVPEAGIFTVYAAVEPGLAAECIKVMREELYRIPETLTHEEFDLALRHLRAVLLLGHEGTEERCSRLVRHELLFGRAVPLSETLSLLDAVTLDDVRAEAENVLRPENEALGLCGPDVSEALLSF